MGIFFAILSPALNSVTNYIDKFLLDKYNVPPLLLAFYTGSVALLASIVIVVLIGFPVINTYTKALILISGILTVLQLIPYFKALSLEEASRVVPLFQMIPIIVLILSFFILGEELTIRQYVGSALIIAASFYLTIEKKGKRSIRVKKAFWYMLIASFFSALSLILFKLGIEEIDLWGGLVYEGIGIFIGALILVGLFYRKKSGKKSVAKRPARVFLFAGMNEVIYLSSRYSSFVALNFVPATIVSVLGGLNPVFVFLFGIILTKWFPQISKEIVNKKTIMVKLSSIFIILIGLLFIFL